MTGCPNLSFTCSNISCNIWFCCGDSDKEHERKQTKQPQAPVVPNDNPKPSPPQPQVILLPDHLSKPTPPPAAYAEQPAAPSPPPAPPPPIAAAALAPPPPPAPPPPRGMPTTQTYYPQPATTQQPQTLTAAAPPPKVHDPWMTQTTQMLPSTHPVWSQTPSAAMLPPSVPSHMQMIPACHDDGQSEMVHINPPPRAPARQPSKTMPSTTMLNPQHPAHSSHHLPPETYCYYDEAAAPALPSDVVVPPRVALPLGDSQHFTGMGHYPQGRHWE